MAKIDLKKQWAGLYNPSAKQVATVDVPALNFLMVDGAGNPNTAPAYIDALQALYGVSYTLKFMLKKRAIGDDYTVMPLEGLWWTDDMSQFRADDKDAWLWTAMIAQPAFVAAEQVAEAIDELRRKKGAAAPAALALLRYETFVEGLAAQIMHIGPYAAEAPNIQRVHAYIQEQGYALAGKHHEIYLSDPNRTAPEKLKTVVRQPMRKP